MDIATTMTTTQFLLTWTLVGLLLAWMIVFALLALKPESRERPEADNFASSHSARPQLHVVVHQQVERPVGNIQLEASTVSNSARR